MGRIKQLSPIEAQKIAAGQVVERPANIVKELVENALDAGATQISIFIVDAGKTLIRIVDNGCGMDQDDAFLCFAHHATSKIMRIDELTHVNTFGFRGEALSSISAVSNVVLITKQAAAAQGLKIALKDGHFQPHELVAATDGTDISISDLFFNVPARKKFLKTNETEWRQILLLFQAFCLSHLNVHFKLYSQSSLLFNCPATSDAVQRIAQLWDHTIAQQLLPVASENNTFKGAISNHTYHRYDRSALFFFVNNRWVKNYTLSKAVLKGYLNVLPSDKFPLICITITIDPSQVDVNVHPRKEEVQFLHPRLIEQELTELVKKALEAHVSAQVQKTVRFETTPPGMFAPQPAPSFTFKEIPEPFNTSQSFAPFAHQELSKSTVTVEVASASQNNSVISIISDDQEGVKKLIDDHYRIIGQLLETYILAEQNDALLLIDQHAAHERILYEQLSAQFDEVATIALLFPVVMNVTSEEIALFAKHEDLFRQNHIGIEHLGHNQLIITSVPVHAKHIDLQELVREALSWIADEQSVDSATLAKRINEKLHAQMACKAAVKAGDLLSVAHMQQLLDDLKKTSNRFACPHGRPTSWTLSQYELEKKFKRKA